MVSRQLHNEGSGFACEHLGLFEHYAGYDYRGHADEVSAGGYQGGAAEHGAGYHGYEGHLSAAGDKGGGHYGHAPVALVLYGSAGHYAGNAAANADEHRNEGLTGKAELAEHPVKYKCDTGHVAAGLKEGEQQEKHQHLRYEAKHRAHAGNDTVKYQALQPFGGVCVFKRVAYQHRYAGYPHAVVSGIGLFKAVFFNVSSRVNIGHGDNVIVLFLSGGDLIVVSGQLVNSQGLLILNLNGAGGGFGNEVFYLLKGSGLVEVLSLGIYLNEGVDGVHGVGVFFAHFFILSAANAEQMEAIAEQAVICPVGSRSTYGDHGDVVNKEHYQREYGQAQPAVGHDLVYLIGGGKAAGILFLVAALYYLRNVDVTLVGDYGFGVVVQLFFSRRYVLLDMVHGIGGNVQLLKHLIIALENLYGVPALLFGGHVMHSRFFNMRNGMLHGAGEGVHRHGLGGLGGLYRSLRRFHNAGALQRGYFNYFAAKLAGKLAHVYLVAVLLYNVHHVDGYHHGDTKLGKLCGEVKVTLKVGAVDNVQYRVRPFGYQIVTRNNFLKGVRGKGVNTGQVHYDNVVVLLQPAFLLFNRYARPVTHELVGAGERVEQRRFAAVRVARKGYLYCHVLLLSVKSI